MSDSNRGLGERWPILLVFVYEQQLALGWPLGGGFLSSYSICCAIVTWDTFISSLDNFTAKFFAESESLRTNCPSARMFYCPVVCFFPYFLTL